ncbi:unnamed protein product [Diamesa hyperborea]
MDSFGSEVRELKLGATFTNPNARNVFHTLKYDFKPASVDVHKEATLQTGLNNQVTVTVPHLDGSGTPNTVFKGSQRDYTKKECVLIINRDTNEIILEKLHNNIQVKKTRTDSTKPGAAQQQQQSNPSSLPPATNKVENQTARHSSKTRVSTGVRKNILNYVPKHSPLQGSPSYHPHRSPQQAPLWNANNTQQTLPSIPIIGLDDGFANSTTPVYSSKSNNNLSSNNLPSSNASTSMSKSSAIQQQPQQLQQQQLQQQQQQILLLQQQQQQQQSLSQQQQLIVPHIQQREPMAIDETLGVLSSSESSSSESNDSDSDSDSAASSTNNQVLMNNHVNNNNNININNNIANINISTSNMGNNHLGNSTAILREDLCLSDSGSDSDY